MTTDETVATVSDAPSQTVVPARPPIGPRIAVAAVVGVVAGVFALVLPDVTGGHPGGAMTHYMGLLVTNQPWNLIVFMAIPVILAETLAVTELVMLFRSPYKPPAIHALNRWAGLIAGPWFFGITIYLLKNAVIPLSSNMAWHGIGDYIAVFAYLLGVVPLVGIFLIELGILGRGTDRARLKLHATFVGFFLIVAHIAMIFGMLDPTLLGYVPADAAPMEAATSGM
jgi:hypothetical protein